jgi:hypothetical protein
VKVDDSTIVVGGSADAGITYTIQVFVVYVVDGKEMRSNVISKSFLF